MGSGCCEPIPNWRTKRWRSRIKGLWLVEALIRTPRSILETRPIYPKGDETIRGHVFCSLLAGVRRAELEKRLRERDEGWEWSEILRGLDNLQEVEAVFQGHRFFLRKSVSGARAQGDPSQWGGGAADDSGGVNERVRGPGKCVGRTAGGIYKSLTMKPAAFETVEEELGTIRRLAVLALDAPTTRCRPAKSQVSL